MSDLLSRILGLVKPGTKTSDPVLALVDALIPAGLRSRFKTMADVRSARAQASAMEDTASVGSKEYAEIRTAARLLDSAVLPRYQLAERIAEAKAAVAADVKAATGQAEALQGELSAAEAEADRIGAQLDRIEARQRELQALITSEVAAPTDAVKGAEAGLQKALSDDDRAAEAAALQELATAQQALQTAQARKSLNEATLAAASAEAVRLRNLRAKAEDQAATTRAALETVKLAAAAAELDGSTTAYIASALLPLFVTSQLAKTSGGSQAAVAGIGSMQLAYGDWRRVPFAPSNSSTAASSFPPSQVLRQVAEWIVSGEPDLSALSALDQATP